MKREQGNAKMRCPVPKLFWQSAPILQDYLKVLGYWEMAERVTLRRARCDRGYNI
ncbi:MAG: hypothetical protein LUF92_10465 [Clostridiales bacterium]|nr:hypothetical protein [Clostridiales bacterium]